MNVLIESAQSCPQCRGENDADARFCKHCAFDLSAHQVVADSTPNFELEPVKSRNNLPLIVGGIVIAVLIGAVGLFAWFRSSNSATDNSNSANSSTVTLDTKAQAAEAKILRGESLVAADIEGLTQEELRIVRNVHFARYGRKYDQPGLGDYFYSRAWYKPNESYSDSMINDTDKANVDLIVRTERSMTSPDESTRSLHDAGDGEDIQNEYSASELDAQKEADRFWQKRFTRCGGSYYHHFLSPFHEMSGTPAYEIFAELKDLSWNTYGEAPQPKTTADRLNQRDSPSGIAWKGKTEAFISARRYWLSRNTSDDRAGWNRWEDKSGALEAFEMVKQNGKWTFNGRNWYNPGFQERPVICNEIPTS